MASSAIEIDAAEINERDKKFARLARRLVVYPRCRHLFIHLSHNAFRSEILGRIGYKKRVPTASIHRSIRYRVLGSIFVSAET